MPNTATSHSKRLAPLWGILLAIVIIMCAIAVWSSRNDVVYVRGYSMSPTLLSGDTVILHNSSEEIHREDLVVFPNPKAWQGVWLGPDDNRFLKRVSLVGGDTLKWDGSAWFRNGEQFSSVIEGSCSIPAMEYTLKRNELFVTGDRIGGATLDSREAFCRGLPYTIDKDTVIKHGQISRIFRR